jgi:hypothetical protein
LEQDRDQDNDTFDNFLVIAGHILEVHNIADDRQDQNAKQGVECGSAMVHVANKARVESTFFIRNNLLGVELIEGKARNTTQDDQSGHGCARES